MYLNSISYIFVYRCDGEIGELSVNENEQGTLAFIMDDILIFHCYFVGLDDAGIL